MAAAVGLPGPMPVAAAPAITPTIPATIALATAIVLGHCRVPGDSKMAIIDGQAGRYRDQAQGRAACQEAG
jgi:hypothetical protein